MLRSGRALSFASAADGFEGGFSATARRFVCPACAKRRTVGPIGDNRGNRRPAFLPNADASQGGGNRNFAAGQRPPPATVAEAIAPRCISVAEPLNRRMNGKSSISSKSENGSELCDAAPRRTA
jgi:hypothetical protein